MEDAELVIDPRWSFNADESGCPVSPTIEKCWHLVVQGLYTLLQGKRAVIVCLVCFNAIRQYMPPLIVFSRKCRRNLDLPEDAYHEVLPNGWMTAEVFLSSCICLICLHKRFLYLFCCMPLHTVPGDNRVSLQAKEIMFNDECQTLSPYNVPVDDKTGADKIEITILYRNKFRYSHSGETWLYGGKTDSEWVSDIQV